jgi:hypothetical protein
MTKLSCNPYLSNPNLSNPNLSMTNLSNSITSNDLKYRNNYIIDTPILSKHLYYQIPKRSKTSIINAKS